MTVKEIFELRKRGKIEEAYKAIIPLYRVHKDGHYTSLCMFWTGLDVLRLRIEKGRTKEATLIFASLVKLYPTIEDENRNMIVGLVTTSISLFEQLEQINKREIVVNSPVKFIDFILQWGLDTLNDKDYQSVKSTNPPIPSKAVQIASLAFHEAKQIQDSDYSQKALKIIDSILSHRSNDRKLIRYKASLLADTNQKEEAKRLYLDLLHNCREAYIYSEYASLLDDPAEEVGFLCMAINNQRTNNFTQKDRLRLAQLMADVRPHYARYELDQCLKIRNAIGLHNNKAITQLLHKLDKITPATPQEQQAFYIQMNEYLKNKYRQIN